MQDRQNTRRYAAVQVYVPADAAHLWEVARIEANARGISLSALVTEALKAALGLK